MDIRYALNYINPWCSLVRFSNLISPKVLGFTDVYFFISIISNSLFVLLFALPEQAVQMKASNNFISQGQLNDSALD